MVEGHGPQTRQPLDPIRADFDDSLRRRFDILENGDSRNAHSRDFLRSQIFGSSCIRPSRATAVMRASVDFDRQSSCRAIEVQHVDSCRMLSSEFQAKGSLAQFAP